MMRRAVKTGLPVLLCIFCWMTPVRAHDMHASERIGAIKRNAAGKIVRAQPEACKCASESGFHAVRALEFKRRAGDMQQQIDRIVERERIRKGYGATVNGLGLTTVEQALASRLAKIDGEVRQHEMKHYLTGRPYTETPIYWYVIGPDKRRYATAGVTPLDMTATTAAGATYRDKLEMLRRAALAPLQPSETDRNIAAAIDEKLAKLPPK